MTYEKLTSEQYNAVYKVLTQVQKIDRWAHKLISDNKIDLITYARLSKGIESASARLWNKLATGRTFEDGSTVSMKEDPLDEMFKDEMVTYYSENMSPEDLKQYMLLGDYQYKDGSK